MSQVMQQQLRLDLEPPPYRIAKLPIHRGYPVPWFVAWMANGEPEFRAMDGKKLAMAVNEHLCWVCGEKLGSRMTFPIGPMCAVNRISAEPPSHFGCATYAVKNCPFLSKPQMERRENNMPEHAKNPGGHMIMRNPGVTALWTTKKYEIINDPGGGVLFRFGDAVNIMWYREGRMATRAEVEESTTTGLPALVKLCRGESETRMLAAKLVQAKKLWPAA